VRLYHRISTLLKADAHGVVDAVEDRSLLLRQHLREAELEIQRKRARLEALEAEEKTLAEEEERLETALRRVNEDVTLALSGGKDELARFAVRKHLLLEKRRTRLQQRAKEDARERTSLAETLSQHEVEFQQLRERVKAHLAQATASERGQDVDLVCDPVVAEEEIEIELLRRKRAARKGGR
jgi:phage shock protein A